MKTYTVAELKKDFSAVMDAVRQGEEIAVSYGRKKTKVAVILPYDRVVGSTKRKLGILKRKGRCVIHKDFSITDEELAGS